MDGQLIPMMGSCCDGGLQVCSRIGWDSTRFATPGWFAEFRESYLTPRELQLLGMYHRPNVLYRAEGEVKG